MDPIILKFLADLAANNSREWYQDHKADYQQAKGAFEQWLTELFGAFTEAGLVAMEGLAPRDAMYRIFRDVRFHKHKPPYNPWFSAMLGPQGRHTRGAAYYIRVQPGCSYAGAGFTDYWSADMLAALRQEIDYEPQPLVQWLQSEAFATYFGALKGEALKRPPKGYAPDHPHLPWLRQKEWWVEHPLPDPLLTSPELIPYLLHVYQQARPMVDYLNTSLIDIIN